MVTISSEENYNHYAKLSEHYGAMAEWRELRQKTGYDELGFQTDENGIALPLPRDDRHNAMVKRVMQLFRGMDQNRAEGGG